MTKCVTVNTLKLIIFQVQDVLKCFISLVTQQFANANNVLFINCLILWNVCRNEFTYVVAAINSRSLTNL